MHNHLIPTSSQKDSSTRFIACLAIVAAFVALLLIDPLTCGISLRCPFKALTHLYCPGCGGQRAIHAFLHGHLSEALRYNYMFIIFIPLLVVVFLSHFVLSYRMGRRIKTFMSSNSISMTLIALTIAWTIIRNILNI